MRICYINYEWDLEASRGAATQIRETAAALDRLGHRVMVMNRHRMPPERPGGGRRRPLAGWLWEAANHARSVTGIRTELDLLRRLHPDVVVTLHALRFSSVAAARRLGLPVVLEVNASVPDETRRYRPELHLLPGVSDWIERRTLAAADGVFVVSRVLRDYFVARGLPAGNIAVIPNGADPGRFRPEAADPELRRRFPGRVLVGFAGSFARFHGIDLLEEAIRQVPAHFVLAGDGAGARVLQARVAGLDNVTFLGGVAFERMPGILAAMDILVAPYPAQDQFYFSPIKLFEYMACGRAVVSARLGQIAEVIQDGRNGLLYDPACPGDFAAKLARLAADPGERARLGREARRTIEENYTWDHHGRRIAELLERVISSAPRRCAAPARCGR
jgi:glycosyltransferase involved in cell wall biosynthesis